MEQGTERIVYVERKSNGMAIAGFVLSLVALLLCWVPGLSWILWLLGLIFSIIGVCRPNNRGLAIAGLVISFIGAVIIICLIIAIGLAVLTTAI